MRWKIESEPKVGDVRFKRKFAWFPVRVILLEQRYYIWLEHYMATEQFTRIVVREGMFSYCKLKWLTVEKGFIMKERIKELAKKADAIIHETVQSRSDDVIISAWEQKFAELVVKECRDMFVVGSVSWNLLNEKLEHFGVE